VPYSGGVAALIEETFTAFAKGESGPEQVVSIDTPGGTNRYLVNVQTMTQTNMRAGGRTVPMRRIESVRSAESVAVLQGTDVPDWLVQMNDAMLPLDPGVLLEVKNERDGWAYGTALFCEDPNIPTGASGWFPISMTNKAPTELQLAFQASLGDYADDKLDPPDTWVDVDQMGPEAKTYAIKRGSPEFANVQDKFTATVRGLGTVEKIERIQNLPLWQSFAVKRLQIEGLPNPAGHPLVAPVAWHGTTHDIAEKILQQGFNRSFCGRNMCR
jgi:hypothetical protein